jgi:type III secretion system YscD/HrpQ family protein
MPAHLFALDKGLILEFKEGDEWVIGRDPNEADLVVEDHTVSRRHARVKKEVDGYTLENLSRVNPALLNGEPAVAPMLLLEGDEVRIGHTLFVYSDEELPKVSPKEKSGYDDIFSDLQSEELPPLPETPAPEEEIAEEESPYDTIFQTDDSGELPLQLQSDSPLILKVISGPNAGAEIGLERDRSYLIGKDPSTSEIVFQDWTVSKTHASLSIGEDGTISLEDLGSKNGTAVNGELIREKRTITSQDLIAIGTTLFLIVDKEAPQETIYAPAPVQEVAKPAAEEEADLSWRQKKIPPKHLIFVGSLAAMFLIAFISFFSLFKASQVETDIKAPSEKIAHALKKFPDLQFSYNPASGRLFLTGHVLTSVDFQELHYTLGLMPEVSGLEESVVIDELVWRNYNDLLNDNPDWRSVSIQAQHPGRFTVNGYVGSTDIATALADYLTVNFPYLDRLENRVVVDQVLNTEIQSILATSGFGAVDYQMIAGEVVLTGLYSEKKETEYHAMVKRINQLMGVRGVKDLAFASHPDAAIADLSSQYQVGGTAFEGGVGVGAALNGKIYNIGDAVDGMKIVAIDSRQILLEKDGIKYKIGYTR